MKTLLFKKKLKIKKNKIIFIQYSCDKCNGEYYEYYLNYKEMKKHLIDTSCYCDQYR